MISLVVKKNQLAFLIQFTKHILPIEPVLPIVRPYKRERETVFDSSASERSFSIQMRRRRRRSPQHQQCEPRVTAAPIPSVLVRRDSGAAREELSFYHPGCAAATADARRSNSSSESCGYCSSRT